MPKFAFTADLHLRQYIWKSRPDLTGDTHYALRQIVDACVAESLNLVMGGDQFDTPYPSSADMHFLQQQVDRLLAAGCQAFAYDGNHDGQPVSWMQQVHGVQLMDRRLTEVVPGAQVYALNYQPAQPLLENLVQVPPQTQVLCLHQFDRHVSDIPGQWDFDAAMLPPLPNLKLVLMGHIHRPYTFEDRGVTFAYCGSPAMQEIAETHPKSFLVVDTADWSLDRRPLDSRHVLNWRIPDEAALSALIAEHGGKILADLPPVADANVNRPIVKCQFPEDLAGAETRLRAAFGAAAHIWPDPVRSLDEAPAVSSGAVAAEQVLAELVDPRKHPELFEFVLALLRTQAEPAGLSRELEMMRERHQVQRPGVAA